MKSQVPEIELNQFFFLRGKGNHFWSHYFYLKPVMYRIDCFFSHTPKSIKEYKSKIDEGESFYEPESKGLSMNLPYPQLDNGNIYDKLYYYSCLELEWNYIQNQFYDTVLNNKYFDFWGAELDHQPIPEVFGGEHWRLIVDISIDGKRKHKEITGYSSYPDGFTFFETFLNDFDTKSRHIPIVQNIYNPENLPTGINEVGMWKRLLNIIFKKT